MQTYIPSLLSFNQIQKKQKCAHIFIVPTSGATYFTDLNIAVKPKIGRALLWPSILDSNPKDQDPRTHHEAQDVIRGIKFGANAWLHLHDYVTAKEMGCT